jgi:hypothetical protein
VIRGLQKCGPEPAAAPEKVKEEPIQNHSKKTKGTFFDSLFKKGKQFFDEDVN